jgi:hypothetical protein
MTFENQHERLRLLRLYEGLGDDALLRIAEDWDSLTEVARDAIEDELERRGLSDELERMLAETEQVSGTVTEHRPLVTVRKFGDLHEALLAKGMFDAAGIECFLVDENMVRLDWLISNILGGVKLAVRTENLGAATELLTEPMPAGFRVEGVGLYEQPSCPACGLQNVRMLEVDSTEPDAGALWRCRACGQEWKTAV